MTTTLRIHPAIGVSRTGNSPDFILAPETSAGMPTSDPNLSGGLPIVANTENQTISDKDLRDAEGRLKPHAQRFRIYAYNDTPDGTYPYKGDVSEVCIGSTVDGKTVKSITWMVHMANKKANCWVIPEEFDKANENNQDANFGVGCLSHYHGGKTPNVRNGNFGKNANPTENEGQGLPPEGVDMSDPKRLQYLHIDAGPKVISTTGNAHERIMFDKHTPCQYITENGTVENIDYPIQFPDMLFSNLYQPSGNNLDSLGGMETDDKGRLVVIGSAGYAASWMQNENNPGGAVPPETPKCHFPLNSDIDNNGWFDDVGDGPITAALHLDDGTVRVIDVPAWCICADPAYAPQIRNSISIWDEIYDTWLRNMELDTSIYNANSTSQEEEDKYNKSGYKPSFERDIKPIFRAAHLQMFTTSLNPKAIGAHKRLDAVTANSDPASYLSVKNFIRSPYAKPREDGEQKTNKDQLRDGVPLMPLALGDTGSSFLTLTKTQYFFLNQWHDGNYEQNDDGDLTEGELLDKNTLTNLLGGRFSPGIDLTFIVRDRNFYNPNWTEPNVGPFRVGGKKLDYASAKKGTPFLSLGYTPNRPDTNNVEPGDLCKFMAAPWHTDYNSCATHSPSPNPERNTTLFWSWPAQRPVSVYTYEDYVANGNKFFGAQHFSVRGEGTDATNTSSVGRYQERIKILENWFNIGFVLQGPAIDGFVGEDKDLFLEVESHLTGTSNWSQPWPILTTDKVYPDTVEPNQK